MVDEVEEVVVVKEEDVEEKEVEMVAVKEVNVE